MTDSPSVAEALWSVWARMAESGSPMPPEEELSSRLGVSRNQVREQLIRLEAEGFVRREHGAGTFVNPRAMSAFRLDRAIEFAESLRAAGYRAEVEVLAASVGAVGADEAAQLELTGGAVAVHTTKRWFADGRPAMVASDVIPLRQALEPASDLSGSVFDIVERHGRDSADWLQTSVAAVGAGDEVAGLLGLTAGTPVLRLHQIGLSRRGRAVFLSVDHYHPEIAQFTVMRTVGRRAFGT